MTKTKSTGMAYLLLVLAGIFGIHRFYLNKPLTGILFLLTGGFFFVGILFDLLLIPSMVAEINKKSNPELKEPTETVEEKIARWETKANAKFAKMDSWKERQDAKNAARFAKNKEEWSNIFKKLGLKK